VCTQDGWASKQIRRAGNIRGGQQRQNWNNVAPVAESLSSPCKIYTVCWHRVGVLKRSCSSSSSGHLLNFYSRAPKKLRFN
jgi:hypothetical protein